MAISLSNNKHTASRTKSRLRRQVRGRKKVAGTPDRPLVFKPSPGSTAAAMQKPAPVLSGDKKSQSDKIRQADDANPANKFAKSLFGALRNKNKPGT